MGAFLVSVYRSSFQLEIANEWKYIKFFSSFSLLQGEVPLQEGRGEEQTLEVRAEDKLVSTLPYVEEKDRVCEVKCPKGGVAVIMG
jgi:hypothetical protein